MLIKVWLTVIRAVPREPYFVPPELHFVRPEPVEGRHRKKCRAGELCWVDARRESRRKLAQQMLTTPK